jgi:hypothetical protein
MGRFIIKIKDMYLEYSSITDSPVTFGMVLDEFKKYYKTVYGATEMHELEIRLKRVDEQGTSGYYKTTLEDFLAGNRAGPNESTLTTEEIYKAYCLYEPIRDGWKVPVAGADLK